MIELKDSNIEAMETHEESINEIAIVQTKNCEIIRDIVRVTEQPDGSIKVYVYENPEDEDATLITKINLQKYSK